MPDRKDVPGTVSGDVREENAPRLEILGKRDLIKFTTKGLVFRFFESKQGRRKFWVRAFLQPGEYSWAVSFDDLVIVSLMIAACEEEKYPPEHGLNGANQVALFLEALAKSVRGGNWESEAQINLVREALKDHFQIP